MGRLRVNIRDIFVTLRDTFSTSMRLFIGIFILPNKSSNRIKFKDDPNAFPDEDNV